MSHPRLALFNVKYSPNLGDGLLSECLEAALVRCGADPATASIDLAARTLYASGSLNRSLKLRVLEALPGPLRPLAVRPVLALAARRQWAPHYAAGLAGADAVVIGGGNLLADLDLNFPTKLALAIHAAAERRLPAFIYACGVSSGWSARGKALLDGALATGAVRQVFLRDERSIALWQELFGARHGLPATLVRDPGLLASTVWPAPPGLPAPDQRPVGLNITSQIAVKYHSAAAPRPEVLEAWYGDFAGAVLAQGRDLAVFTNGSPEDRATLAALRPRLEAMGGARVSFPDAGTPAQLVEIIAGLQGLAAFRMHAIIAGFSCGVPFLALSWDPKLDSFVNSVGRGDWLTSVREGGGAAGAAQLSGAIATGLAEAGRQAIIAEAGDGVAQLYRAITAAIATG